MCAGSRRRSETRWRCRRRARASPRRARPPAPAPRPAMAMRWSCSGRTVPPRARPAAEPFDDQTVGALLDHDASAAQLARQRRDPVGLLDPQFMEVGENRAPGRDARRRRSARGSRRSTAAPARRRCRCRAAREARARTRPTGSPIAVAGHGDLQVGAHRHQRVQHAGAGRVEADALDRDIAAWNHDSAATKRNAADDRSPGTVIGIGAQADRSIPRDRW